MLFRTTNSNCSFAPVATFEGTAPDRTQPADCLKMAILAVNTDVDRFGKVTGQIAVDITLCSTACTDNPSWIAEGLIERLFTDMEIGNRHAAAAEQLFNCQNPRLESAQTIIRSQRNYMTWVEFVGSEICEVEDESEDYTSYLETIREVHGFGVID